MNFRWFGWILLRKLKLELEKSTFPYSLLWPFDECVPSEKVAFERGSINPFLLLIIEFFKIFE
jgi:hypothetical protein